MEPVTTCTKPLTRRPGTQLRNNNNVAMHIDIKQGLDIPLAGEPEQSVHQAAPVTQVALCGLDYAGLKPRLLVAEGDKVKTSQAYPDRP